jgi:hypothetical protein
MLLSLLLAHLTRHYQNPENQEGLVYGGVCLLKKLPSLSLPALLIQNLVASYSCVVLAQSIAEFR